MGQFIFIIVSNNFLKYPAYCIRSRLQNAVCSRDNTAARMKVTGCIETQSRHIMHILSISGEIKTSLKMIKKTVLGDLTKNKTSIIRTLQQINCLSSDANTG